ncbi:MAG: CRISPR-associated endonuclease Cas2 [Corynebacterium sp.]|nr:CRISPR-associated endonuclease Cas2 [Corynebacterium sp.]
MFDLPVKTKPQTTAANRFRNQLLDLGFSRVQFSVYAQYFPLASRVQTTVKQVKSQLPDGGDIRVIMISDYEWSHAIRFSNKKETKNEEMPTQLAIF